MAHSITMGDPRRCRSDRGTALLEAVFVLPIAMLLYFGVFAMGTLFKGYASTAHAVRAGGRMASLFGADPMADQQALARVSEESFGIRPDTIEYIAIWHATGPGATPPSGCKPATHTTPNTSSVGVSDAGVDALGACNVYIRPAMAGGAFDMANGLAAHPASYYFGCQGASDPQASHMVDCRWPGKDRKATVSPRAAVGTLVAPDYVGIYLSTTHRVVLPLGSTTLTVSDRSVNLIEPRTYAP